MHSAHFSISCVSSDGAGQKLCSRHFFPFSVPFSSSHFVWTFFSMIFINWRRRRIGLDWSRWVGLSTDNKMKWILSTRYWTGHYLNRFFFIHDINGHFCWRWSDREIAALVIGNSQRVHVPTYACLCMNKIQFSIDCLRTIMMMQR